MKAAGRSERRTSWSIATASDARVTTSDSERSAEGHRAARGTRPVLVTALRQPGHLSRRLHRVWQAAPNLLRHSRSTCASSSRSALHHLASASPDQGTPDLDAGAVSRTGILRVRACADLLRSGRCLTRPWSSSSRTPRQARRSCILSGGQRLWQVVPDEGGHRSKLFVPRRMARRRVPATRPVPSAAMRRRAKTFLMRWPAVSRRRFLQTKAYRSSSDRANRFRVLPRICATPRPNLPTRSRRCSDSCRSLHDTSGRMLEVRDRTTRTRARSARGSVHERAADASRTTALHRASRGSRALGSCVGRCHDAQRLLAPGRRHARARTDGGRQWPARAAAANTNAIESDDPASRGRGGCWLRAPLNDRRAAQRNNRSGSRARIRRSAAALHICSISSIAATCSRPTAPS